METPKMIETIINILITLISGGFIIFLIEIENRKNCEYDKYFNFVQPLMNKLSAYCRFVSWSGNSIIFSQNPNENENNLKKSINIIKKEGDMLIVSGKEYSADDFSNKILYEFSNHINNIWCYYDKLGSQKIKIDEDMIKQNKFFIEKELSIINPMYLSHIQDKSLIADVSGNFYNYIEPLIRNAEDYTKKQQLYSIQIKTMLGAVIIIVCFLVLLLFFNSYCLSIILLFTSLAMLIVGLLILCVSEQKQLKFLNKIKVL